MPSGPPELHARWGDDGNALNFLEAQGWKLLRSYDLLMPHPLHHVTDDECSALDYLVLEWDYGDAVRWVPPGSSSVEMPNG